MAALLPQAARSWSTRDERQDDGDEHKMHAISIFDDSAHLHRFSNFPHRHRPASEPLLTYFLDALKALRAIEYSNAVLRQLGPLNDFSFTREYYQAQHTANPELQHRQMRPLTSLRVKTYPLSVSIRHRIMGTPSHVTGVYEHYLLVRPYPSFRILFTSPSMRVPGILQSPLLDRIGGSEHMRDQLVEAFANGQSVTAKVKWLTISHRAAAAAAAAGIPVPTSEADEQRGESARASQTRHPEETLQSPSHRWPQPPRTPSPAWRKKNNREADRKGVMNMRAALVGNSAEQAVVVFPGGTDDDERRQDATADGSTGDEQKRSSSDCYISASCDR
ncbi:hypothetical protein E4U41_001425 [Claviceps citrina]|nr:hypothetical protein E4U41_001425 [Claviceps citrina]